MKCVDNSQVVGDLRPANTLIKPLALLYVKALHNTFIHCTYFKILFAVQLFNFVKCLCICNDCTFFKPVLCFILPAKMGVKTYVVTAFKKFKFLFWMHLWGSLYLMMALYLFCIYICFVLLCIVFVFVFAIIGKGEVDNLKDINSHMMVATCPRPCLVGIWAVFAFAKVSTHGLPLHLCPKVLTFASVIGTILKVLYTSPHLESFRAFKPVCTDRSI